MDTVLVLLGIGFICIPVIQSFEDQVKTWQFGNDSSSSTLFRTIRGEVPPSKFTKINLDLPECFSPTFVTLTLLYADPTSATFYDNSTTTLYVFCSILPHQCKFRVAVKGVVKSDCIDYENSPKKCSTPDCRGSKNQDSGEVVCIPVKKPCSTPDCQNPRSKYPIAEKPCVGSNCQPKLLDVTPLESILKNAPIPDTYSNTNNVACTKSSCRTFATNRGLVPIINFLAARPATTILNSKPPVKPILNYLTLDSDKPNTRYKIKADSLVNTLLSNYENPPSKCTIKWEPQVTCDPSRAGDGQQRISKKPCLTPDCASELVKINQENPVDLTRYIAQSVEHDDEDYEHYFTSKHFKSDDYYKPDNYKREGFPEYVFDGYNFSDDYINNLIPKNADGENRRAGLYNDGNNYLNEEAPIVDINNLPTLNKNDV